MATNVLITVLNPDGSITNVSLPGTVTITPAPCLLYTSDAADE